MAAYAPETLLSDPFVAFVGAGASALPPSNLPTWTAFNSIVLESLCAKLDETSRNRQPTEAILKTYNERREETAFFTPDFQAQLMEEEVGADYFRVWQGLQIDTFGPVHAALAELAAGERLAAVITTNFDCLIEAALTSQRQPFRVYHDSVSFEQLAAAEDGSGQLPIIKIHGSVEDPESLVDTLRQRLVGRPTAIQTVLNGLLRSNTWVYLGFSGADFTHVPNYLNVLGSSAEAKGFVFLNQPGATLQAGLRRLVDAYGSARAEIVDGDLATWLPATFGHDAETSIPTQPVKRKPVDAIEHVRAGVREWVSHLGPISVVNITFAMLQSCGLEHAAFWLMRKTWKSYRRPEDTQGIAYNRYNFNYGCALTEVGFIHNPIPLADDYSNLLEWKTYADQNAYEFLARSYHAGRRPAAGAALARVLAYRGDVAEAVSLAAQTTEDAYNAGPGLEYCEVAIASAVIYDIVQMFTLPIKQLNIARDLAEELGDESRRAHLAALLGRFLSYAGRVDEAEPFLSEAEETALRLDLFPVKQAANAARGIWHVESGQPEDGIGTLQPLAEALRAHDDESIFTHIDIAQPDPEETQIKGVTPLRVRVLLDLNRAANLAGDAELMTQTLDELDVLATNPFLGYCPQYYLAYAQCLIIHGEEDQSALINDLLERMENFREDASDPLGAWAKQAAETVRQHWGHPSPDST